MTEKAEKYAVVFPFAQQVQKNQTSSAEPANNTPTGASVNWVWLRLIPLKLWRPGTKQR